MSTFRFSTSLASLFLLYAIPLTTRAETDACTLLTPAQVGAVVGGPVTSGTHVTPTFVKTCTWTPTSKSQVSAATLYLQAAAAYDAGKQLAARVAPAAEGTAVKSAGVGDDSYYFVTGDQAGLLVKKGSVAFKVAIYAKVSLEQKEAMELSLAKQVLTKL